MDEEVQMSTADNLFKPLRHLFDDETIPNDWAIADAKIRLALHKNYGISLNQYFALIEVIRIAANHKYTWHEWY